MDVKKIALATAGIVAIVYLLRRLSQRSEVDARRLVGELLAAAAKAGHADAAAVDALRAMNFENSAVFPRIGRAELELKKTGHGTVHATARVLVAGDKDAQLASAQEDWPWSSVANAYRADLIRSGGEARTYRLFPTA